MSPHSAFSGFLALIGFTFRRQWRTRALGLVTFALLALNTAAIGIVTHVQKSWRLETRKAWMSDPMTKDGAVRMTYEKYASARLPLYEMIPGPAPSFAVKAMPIGVYQFLVASQEAKKFRDEFAFVNYSRWAIFTLYTMFILPLFTLAFASGSLGMERENRTLIWLVTRPLPRWAVYVAKFLGVLPWCVAMALFAFLCFCLVGGEQGHLALQTYWTSVIAGSIALAAMFHLTGAVFRRPTIVGLVYIFFFELLVNNLPGSLKRLSLNYYIRSLMYNQTAEVAPSVKPATVAVFEPLSSLSCWIVLAGATIALTVIGAWLFSNQEPKDEV